MDKKKIHKYLKGVVLVLIYHLSNIYYYKGKLSSDFVVKLVVDNKYIYMFFSGLYKIKLKQ